jgi:hypothetical protein
MVSLLKEVPLIRVGFAAVTAAAAVCLLAAAGCELIQKEKPPVPTGAEAAAYYSEHPGFLEADLVGNVVHVQFRQSQDHLKRGGPLWARSGPYIYLLSPSTQKLFKDYPGVGGVRVITLDANGEQVAQALLPRDTLTETRWKRSLNLLGRAVAEGSRQPRRLEELVIWGEDHTQHEYNPKYVP